MENKRSKIYQITLKNYEHDFYKQQTIFNY